MSKGKAVWTVPAVTTTFAGTAGATGILDGTATVAAGTATEDITWTGSVDMAGNLSASMAASPVLAVGLVVFTQDLSGAPTGK
jgi:hypothetical protein